MNNDLNTKINGLDFKQIRIGSIIKFGNYPATAKADDFTPISWLVLEKNRDNLFLLSEKILDCLVYHDAPVKIEWQDSEIRSFLNGNFYNTAFNDTEKELIISKTCPQNDTQKNGSPKSDSPYIADKVFLPSIAEVFSYFGKDKATNCGFSTVNNSAQALSTTYARQPSKKKGRKINCKLGVFGEGKAKNAARWWLSDIGCGHDSTHPMFSFVDYYGSVDYCGAPSDFCICGIRPCIILGVKDIVK